MRKKVFYFKKRGFTLIELLAVIVILAIILLIVMPLIIHLIEDARKNAFLRTGEMIIRTGDLYAISPGEEAGKIYELVEPRELPFARGNLKFGELKYDENSNIAMAIWDGRYCIVKDFGSDDLVIIKNEDGTNCNLNSVTTIVGDPGATGYACINPPGDLEITPEYYFTFDQETRTITGYSSEGPKDLVIPCTIGGANVEYIGNNAFSSMALTSVMMPDVILEIGARAFRDNLIDELELSNNLEIIGANAFADNDLIEIVFPDSLRRIENSERYTVCGWISCSTHDRPSFIGNPLQSVTFGSGIEYIGKAVFRDRTTLTDVDFSNSINLETIAADAFRNTVISEVNIPSSVTTILSNAFANNAELALIFIRGKVDESHFDLLGSNWSGTSENIIYELASCYVYDNGVITDYHDICVGNIEIPETLGGAIVTTIAANAFANKGLTRVVIPTTITTIGDNAFANNNIDPIVVEGKSDSSGFASLGADWHDESHIVYENDDETCYQVNSVTITGYYNESVCPKEIVIPGYIEIIAEAAFDTLGITVVNFNNVQSIGSGAFNNNSLSEVIIPNSVTTIGNNPFTGSLLTNVTVQDGTKFISLGSNWYGNVHKVVFEGSSYELNCFGVDGSTITNYPLYCPEEVIIPTSVEGVNIDSVAANAFKNKAIRFVTLGSHIVTIGNNAFEQNNIAVINISEGLEIIGDQAFYNTGMLKITLPASVKEIGIQALASNPDLEEIIVIGKADENDFEYLGENWNGSCDNISYMGD